jgi:hypothetical protein
VPAPIGTPGEAAPGAEWFRQRGTAQKDEYHAVVTDTAGNIFAAGTSSGSYGYINQGGTDAILAQHFPDGGKGWTRQLGTAGDDKAYDVVTDSAGNIIIVGSTKGNLARNVLGGSDAFVAKYSPSGTRLWVKQFGRVYFDELTSVAIDGSGNIYAAGFSTNFISSEPQAHNDPYLLKLDPNGNLHWEHFEPYYRADSPGFLNVDVRNGLIYAVAATYNELVLMRFAPDGSKHFHTIVQNVFAANDATVDNNGTFLVAAGPGVFRFGSSGMEIFGVNLPGGDSHIRTIEMAPNGDILLGGDYSTFEPSNGHDGFVARSTADGESIWVQRVGRSSRFDQILGVGHAPGGKVVAVGSTADELFTTSQGEQDTILLQYP